MTLTASTSLLMSSLHRRWMTRREVMSTQGFPVDTADTFGQPCSAFALRWDNRINGRPHSSWPSRHAIWGHAGNSMHTSCSGLMILFCLSQVIVDQSMMNLQWFLLNRRARLGRHAEALLAVPVQSPGRVQHASQESHESDGRRKRRRVHTP